jgi:hypothetical protein
MPKKAMRIVRNPAIDNIAALLPLHPATSLA